MFKILWCETEGLLSFSQKGVVGCVDTLRSGGPEHFVGFRRVVCFLKIKTKCTERIIDFIGKLRSVLEHRFEMRTEKK
jgi:hypothetical protein